MNLEKIDEKDNRLLLRKELQFLVKFEGPTPSMKNLQDLLQSNGYDSERLVIYKTQQKYGGKEMKVFVKYYDTKDAKEKIELKKKEKASKGEKNG
ncbi:MAG: hypothetical protein QW735_00245 [archaeon]